MDLLEETLKPPVDDMPAGRDDSALVAVVEDEALVLAGYQMLFDSWGYQVVSGGSAQELLRNLPAGGRVPDVILADYRLKDGQNGMTAIRAIEIACCRKIPAILVTGDTGAEWLREAAASGLPIVHKPVNGVQLRELLQRCLRPLEV
ncbi:response regulator [Telmatospirillum sp.]|uniref:response regulator n=1 Tax=Telmatospirillum sp. TaxID=2079197 RepID=UPI00283C943D|nr:response regulator [Telmatospirillum sp.]MDR3441214.1 response regulator [Telmatospirillum sp.]